MTLTIQLEVIGEEKMHCSGCETRVGYALRRLSGVTQVRASAETQQVSVTFDPDLVSAEQVQTRLREIGYQAVVSARGAG